MPEFHTFGGRHENCYCGIAELPPEIIEELRKEVGEGKRSKESFLAYLHPPERLRGPHKKAM
jgi:hypothetical protein